MGSNQTSPGAYAGLWRVHSQGLPSCRLSLSLRGKGENFAVDLEGCSSSALLSSIQFWRPDGAGIALLNKQGDRIYAFSTQGPDRLAGVAGAPLDLERAPE